MLLTGVVEVMAVVALVVTVLVLVAVLLSRLGGGRVARGGGLAACSVEGET